MNYKNASRIPHRAILLAVMSILFWCIGITQSYAAINFEPPIEYLHGLSPAIITYADFDSDGDTDLATVHNQDGGLVDENNDGVEAILFHLNNGDGSFTLGSSVYFTEHVVSVASADFDADGDIDLATANGASDDIAILLNDGSGTFALESRLTADLVTPTGIASADFDADGDIDLAVTVNGIVNDPETGPALVIFSNDGTGVFMVENIFFTLEIYGQATLDEIVAADINDDSVEDIAVIIGNSITLFINNNDGTFTNSQLEIPSGNALALIVPIDIDNDGDIDFIASQHGNENDINIVLNDGGGNFHYEKTINIQPGVESFVATDMDNDGDIDITIPSGNALLYILLQDDSGDFILQEDTIGYIPWLSGNAPIITTDLNDDGKPDVVIAAAYGAGPESKTLIFLQTSSDNQQPILDPIGNQTVDEGELLEFTLSATDPDGDELTFAAANIPEGSTFDPETGVFSWTPDFDDAGNYENIEFSVMDNGNPMELDVELITITVGDINRAPEIINPGPQEVLEEDELIFEVTATDPDNNSVTLSATDLPTGATFDGANFVWTPDTTQEGTYTVSFTATDDGTPNESSIIGVVITVGNNPTPIEQAEDIVEDVITIELPQNVENSYLANLLKVEQFIAEGKITPAVNQLNAFINKVNQDLQQGLLTQSEADALIEAAEALRNELLNN